MHIKPIHTSDDYENALKRIEIIMDAQLGSEEFDELDILSTLVESYEEKNFPMENPDPIDAIKFRMEQLGINRTELQEIIHCGRGRISEVLNKKRPLSLNMIRAFNHELHIPSDVLVKEYRLKEC
jgi:HTH-type transcriptional regulator / antitoxin HigA